MDRAHRWTDGEIEALERRMAREYGQAVREMREKLDRFLEKYASELEQRERALDDTHEARKELEGWKRDRAADRRWMEGMVRTLSADLQQAQARAMALVEDRLPRIYAENADFAAFEVDRAARTDTAFTLMDEDTARQLMGRGDLLFEPPRPDAAKVAAWTDRKVTGAVTQGILQGESIPRIAQRVAEVAGMSRRAAVRTARTACTGAENAGRVSSYQRAQRLGIGLRQEWLATLDMRTRDSHRLLDGERVEVGEEFSNGLRFPGDPQGRPEEVYNCRCTLVAAVDGVDQSAAARFDRLPDGMTYDEWRDQARRRMEGQQVGEPDVIRVPEHQVVEGRDILGTWQRRPDEYDFEIEDVMAAQGFDGKPRIVDADEFDRAVKQANGGDGLIMQRVYSAPDQATLDAYRDQLYHGKWYVDCSTGGAQYGQGMYVAADYTGTLTDGIRSEMEHYMSLNRARGAEHAYVETMTLDPSARVVTYEDAYKLFHSSPNRDSAIRQWADAYLREDSESPLTDNEFAWVMRKSGVWKKDPSMTAAEWGASEPNISGITDSRMWSLDEDLSQEIMKRVKSGELAPDDVGAHMVKLGYDAINAVGHGASGSYTVVLNRTKLIIRRPE